jgi:hypothetical protein
MAKLCPRGKSSSKKENLKYIQVHMLICMLLQFCSGKVTPGGKKNKSQQRKAVSNYKQGGIAKGCGNVMEKRRKVTKKY